MESTHTKTYLYEMSREELKMLFEENSKLKEDASKHMIKNPRKYMYFDLLDYFLLHYIEDLQDNQGMVYYIKGSDYKTIYKDKYLSEVFSQDQRLFELLQPDVDLIDIEDVS